MKAQHLQWTKQHASWSVDQCKSIIFSNEKKFGLHGSDGKQRKDEFHPGCYIHCETEFFPDVWDSIAYSGTGQLESVKGAVNAQDYQSILD